MPRRVQPIMRPEIKLDATLPVPLYKQLYERLRGAILTGQREDFPYPYSFMPAPAQGHPVAFA